jgi:hypothetical protein
MDTILKILIRIFKLIVTPDEKTIVRTKGFCIFHYFDRLIGFSSNRYKNYSPTMIVVSLTDSTPFWDISRSARVFSWDPSPLTRITSRQRPWVT